MPATGWDIFLKTYPAVHLIAGIVPRTANAARLGRPGRLNRTYLALIDSLIAGLRPRGHYATNQVPDATGSMVLAAFELEEDADRLAEVTAAVKSERFLGTWATSRTFLYDRLARRQLVDYVRGQLLGGGGTSSIEPTGQ
jgi:hypothetical protein